MALSLVTWSETHAQRTRRLQSVKNDIKIGARRPWNSFTQPSIDFMDKVLDISGLSDQTFLPDGERFHQQSTISDRNVRQCTQRLSAEYMVVRNRLL